MTTITPSEPVQLWGFFQQTRINCDRLVPVHDSERLDALPSEPVLHPDHQLFGHRIEFHLDHSRHQVLAADGGRRETPNGRIPLEAS